MKLNAKYAKSNRNCSLLFLAYFGDLAVQSLVALQDSEVIA